MAAKDKGGSDLRIRLNDFTVSYDDLGSGPVPVLFVHGFPFDKSSWRPQMEALRHSHRVIAYDIRGFGKSTAGEQKASIRQFADDLIALLDALNIPMATACGLSMGGYILLNAIHRYPERFSSIVFCDTQCIGDTPEGREKRFQAIQSIEKNGLVEFAEGFTKKLFSQRTSQDNIELIEATKKNILSTSPETITATLLALAQRDDACATLGNISVPTLVLCGTEDQLTPVDKSEFLSQHIPRSAFHTIQHAGHLSNLEQPGEFNKLLSDFLATRP